MNDGEVVVDGDGRSQLVGNVDELLVGVENEMARTIAGSSDFRSAGSQQGAVGGE